MSRVNKLYDFLDDFNNKVFSLLTDEKTYKSPNDENNQEQEWKAESFLKEGLEPDTKAEVKKYISMYNG